jgi:D-alanyl-D-alanine carboxypeptidase
MTLRDAPTPPHPVRTRSVTTRVGRRRRVGRRVYVGAVVAGLAASAVAVVQLVSAPTDHVAGSVTRQTDAAPVTAVGLDPGLQQRFDDARAAAAAEGVELWITSGWRTADEQQQLVDDAVERYGSVEEARRWVLPPESSEHVAGTAIDVGPTEGAYWLQQHGADFGLCQTYANEVWHYEAATEPGGACPEMHDDASHGW